MEGNHQLPQQRVNAFIGGKGEFEQRMDIPAKHCWVGSNRRFKRTKRARHVRGNRRQRRELQDGRRFHGHSARLSGGIVGQAPVAPVVFGYGQRVAVVTHARHRSAPNSGFGRSSRFCPSFLPTPAPTVRRRQAAMRPGSSCAIVTEAKSESPEHLLNFLPISTGDRCACNFLCFHMSRQVGNRRRPERAGTRAPNLLRLPAGREE